MHEAIVTFHSRGAGAGAHVPAARRQAKFTILVSQASITPPNTKHAQPPYINKSTGFTSILQWHAHTTHFLRFTRAGSRQKKNLLTSTFLLKSPSATAAHAGRSVNAHGAQCLCTTNCNEHYNDKLTQHISHYSWV